MSCLPNLLQRTVPVVLWGMLLPLHLPAQSPDHAEDEGLTSLNKQGTVLLDREGGRVVLRSQVVLREGLLEMLCCRKQTKEHESILAVDAKAYVIHTALLALGIEPGKPVEFHPEFRPPQGPKIAIFLRWKDKEGKLHRVPAQTWIRTATQRFYSRPLKLLPEGVTLPKGGELKFDERFEEIVWFGQMSKKQRDQFLALSQKEDREFREAINYFYKESQPQQMTADWVFAGSGIYVDEKTGERFYQAEGGDLICVANFPSAMIDVATRSSATGEQNLLYEAYTKHIPPLGTPVTIELIPEKPGKKPGKTKQENTKEAAASSANDAKSSPE